MKKIDHFMYAFQDLDVLNKHFTALTGVEAEAGGSHPDLGTRNRLLNTGAGTYLELIAPDPALPCQSALCKNLAVLRQPQLYRIIARCGASDFEDIIRAYRAVGVAAEVRPLQRISSSGEIIKWHLLMPIEPCPYGIFAPLFIDWLDTPHPVQRLPASACTIIEYEAGHPDNEGIEKLWASLGFSLPLKQSDQAYMKVSLQTPEGLVHLTTD